MTRLAGPIEYASIVADGNGHPEATARRTRTRSCSGAWYRARRTREIAAEIGIDEQAVTRRLGELFARIGASSRAEATAFAFRQRVL